MSQVLVDTSIWIDFFRGNEIAKPLVELIEDGQIVTNDSILAELLPSIDYKGEQDLKELMLSIEKVRLQIDWARIIRMQSKNLANGFKNVGIPDLMIAQNAIDHDLVVFENDRHFRPMTELFELKLFRNRL